jgi:xanthine dehydrogenase accessory factor
MPDIVLIQGGSMQESHLAMVRGAGDLGSSVAVCLHSVGFRVVMTETRQPLAVRRAVCFSDAVYDGTAEVEGVQAIHASTPAQIAATLNAGAIAIVIDPGAHTAVELKPLVLVDAIMAKRNLGTRRSDAPAVIALGPGFCAGDDAHVVIETQRGHNLGRIIWKGAAESDTGIPGAVLGHSCDRVLRAPGDGVVQWHARIGDLVEGGDLLAHVGEQIVRAPFAGALRGAIRDGLHVPAGLKIGDVDPRGDSAACFTISDKARAIAGSTLQAALILLRPAAHEKQE